MRSNAARNSPDFISRLLWAGLERGMRAESTDRAAGVAIKGIEVIAELEISNAVVIQIQQDRRTYQNRRIRWRVNNLGIGRERLCQNRAAYGTRGSHIG